MINKTTVRIIGGAWRGRKIHVAQNQGIRPTTNFIRETLFNWLSNKIINSTCLDLFAGSGVLGFEALSRGAKSVTFVDKTNHTSKEIRENISMLDIKNADVFCSDFKSVLKSKYFDVYSKFDVVFLDPPFRKNLAVEACKWLDENDLLNNNAIIYIETERDFDLDKAKISNKFEKIKYKQSGNVQYSLWIFQKSCNKQI